MKNKMGRPPMPKGTATKVVFAVKLSRTDSKAIEARIKESGQTKSEWMREALLTNWRRFPVNCPEALTKYEGKKVMFRIEHRGDLKGFLGEFLVRRLYPDPATYVSVVCRGLRLPGDPANTLGYSFHLSQAHVDSIIPVSDPDAAFEIQLPFLARHYRPDISPRPPAS